MSYSVLQTQRYGYKPKLPPVLRGAVSNIRAVYGENTESLSDQLELRRTFARSYGKPIVTLSDGVSGLSKSALRVGVILSGGQAPGGHNVITGLFDGLKAGHPDSQLIGFLNGPAGLVDNATLVLDAATIDGYRNTGGFDIIGSGRTKIETAEQFQKALATATQLVLNAVVVIGGDDSNTNAALLAEYFLANGSSIQVIGVPKTIDGDLKNEYIETSFGFDTACKTYSELIGNIARDAISAKKYWHFIKLMGRSASHIALECGLQTQANVTIVSEEVEKQQKTLAMVVDDIVTVIQKRATNGESYGIVLVPEGLIEFIPEMKTLIAELNDTIAHHSDQFAKLASSNAQIEWVRSKLSAPSLQAFDAVPVGIQAQLLMDRDPHGNVQVSRIETERLLIEMCQARIAQLKESGTFNGAFSTQNHFFGYEGRCAFPSNFDADYCYSLGYTAFVLIANGLTGYISSVRNLTEPAEKWIAGGIPLTMMMNLEQRHGVKKPVIRKALVDLEGPAFRFLQQNRDEWAIRTSYLYPGAIQYFGPDEVCNAPTKTILLESR